MPLYSFSASTEFISAIDASAEELKEDPDFLGMRCRSLTVVCY